MKLNCRAICTCMLTSILSMTFMVTGCSSQNEPEPELSEENEEITEAVPMSAVPADPEGIVEINEDI